MVVVVVTCEEDLQLQRLMEQRKLSERESKLMIGAQMPLDQKGKWPPQSTLTNILEFFILSTVHLSTVHSSSIACTKILRFQGRDPLNSMDLDPTYFLKH